MSHSHELFEQAQKTIPGGVNSPVRAFTGVGGTPCFIERAEGSNIFDADGKKYIDYVGSWGPMILGHNHPAILDAVITTAKNGLSFGAPTALEITMAEKVRELVPSMEKLRMVSSGTEATMSAIRLARGYPGDVQLVPSMLLGSTDMSAFEVNQWYNTLANNGIYNEALAINKVISGEGQVLWQRDNIVDARLSQQGAYLIDYALTKVATEGTAKSLSWRFPEKVLSGKTGTSNDLRDSWFVGYDQESVVTTWIGRDDNASTGLTGSSGALTLFANYLKKQGSHSRYDLMPEGVEFATFELATGNAVSDECAKVAKYPAITEGIFYSTECLEKKPEPPSWLEKLFGLGDE